MTTQAKSYVQSFAVEIQCFGSDVFQFESQFLSLLFCSKISHVFAALLATLGAQQVLRAKCSRYFPKGITYGTTKTTRNIQLECDDVD